MSDKEILQRIKLIKDQLTIAQIYKADFLKQLGAKGYDDFVNERLEKLKFLLNLYKNL